MECSELDLVQTEEIGEAAERTRCEGQFVLDFVWGHKRTFPED